MSEETYNPADNEQVNPNPGEPQGQVPEINLGDFAVMIAIIDTVCKRGGFEGPELADVGTLRTRLQAFCDHHKPKDDAGVPPSEQVTQSAESGEIETLDIDEAEEAANA